MQGIYYVYTTTKETRKEVSMRIIVSKKSKHPKARAYVGKQYKKLELLWAQCRLSITSKVL